MKGGACKVESQENTTATSQPKQNVNTCIPKRTLYQVCREYAGLAGATGVKNVSRGLAESAAALGWRSVVILPYYGFLVARIRRLEKVADVEVSVLDKTEILPIWRHQLNGVEIYLLESSFVADKKAVYTYTRESMHAPGRIYVDNEAINMTLQKGALELAKILGAPDIFHAHDAHTALLSVLAREYPQYADFYAKTQFVLTLHNLGLEWHQEIVGLHKAQALTELPTRVLQKGIITGDTVDPLILASHYSHITTVSPEFAKEIFNEENSLTLGYVGNYYQEHGIKITGIYNGVDFASIDPRNSNPPDFPLAYDPTNDVKQVRMLYRDMLVCLSQETQQDGNVEKYGYLVQDPNMILCAVQSRILYEKGIDYLCDALNIVFRRHPYVSVAVMGDGDQTLEYKLIALSKNPLFFGRFVYWRGYNAKLIYPLLAGSDLFIMPSVYEPCGFADLYAQTYGSLPIVHYTGGLKKVVDKVNGFTFHPLDVRRLSRTILSALQIFSEDPQRISAMRKNAFQYVQEQFDWPVIFKRDYQPFYEECLNKG